MMQSGLQQVCDTIVSRSHGAVGWALVDSLTGLPLVSSVAPMADLDGDAMGLIGAGAAAHFKRFSEDEDVVEIQTTTEDAYCFITRVPGDGDQLAVLVLDRAETNLGLGWMAMRRALNDLDVASREADEQAVQADHVDDAISGFDDGGGVTLEPPLVGSISHTPPAEAPQASLESPKRPTRRSIRR